MLLDLPLAAIDATALLRDRSHLDPAALDDLMNSIAAEGLRQPVEVWELANPSPPLRYGLISGLRRLTATRHLATLRRTENPTIAAFLRSPASLPAAMAAMVTENEVRENLTPWERGALLVNAVHEGIFDSIDAATIALHPTASRQKRNRLRNLAQVVDELDGAFTTPEALSLTQMERLAAALRAGFVDLIHHILSEHRGESLPRQWAALTPTLTEAFTAPDGDIAPTPGGRPRRMLQLKQGLTIRREQCEGGWLLRFTGPEARKGGLMDDILDQVERDYQRWST
jgi:ParB family chromosome partitioning protein